MSLSYRYYCHDSDGRLHSAEWFDADSDKQAVELIQAEHPGGTCEIWQETRLVAKITPERLSA
ncbi:MAG: hypothetical protein H0W39_11365 [Sphingomonas sp.]|nr:hypothetical protein [Sphingomonas sp.]